MPDWFRSTLLLLVIVIPLGCGPAVEVLEDGVILDLEQQTPKDPAKLRLQVIAGNIIRVTASPTDTFSDRPSLILAEADRAPVDWSVKKSSRYLTLDTGDLQVKVDRRTGQLSYSDRNGEEILAESGRSLEPATVMGEQTWHVQQLFASPEDEAIYGLGQHQNGLLDYKGHNVDLRQSNMVAVVPFLVSSRHYGILWDNSSRTKLGDIRDSEPISSLKLYAADGSSGGLTAEYFRDTELTDLFTSRVEDRIMHEFIDVNDPYPEGFADNVRAVRWSGEIEAVKAGVHQLRLYCSGYTRMWLDGELVVDSWRQNWLPWTHFPTLDMQPGERHTIKIEWIHSGGYIGLSYLPPHDPVYDTSISLWSEVADQIDYYFIHGTTMDDIIGGYRDLTGPAVMMPKWALGFWQCRERYKTQQELLDVVREFRKRKIPIDNIVQDWFYWPEDQWGSHDFDAERFPDPAGMVKTLHDELHTRIMISVWPKFYVGTEHYEQFKEHGWLYMHNVEQGTLDWVGPGYRSTFYDAYDPGARDLYWQQIEPKLFDLGFDAWWLDATEPDIHSNLSRQETLLRNGPTALGSAARYRNTYSLMNSKGVYEQQREAGPDQRVFILTRSAFAGQQRYAAATWSGDVATRWFDLKVQIPAGLNFCLSGLPYWTTDIGGFAVEPRWEHDVTPEDLEEWRELNTRWLQYGSFTPLFRVHGQYPYREMFNIAPADHPAYQTMLAYDKLRYRLMPYLYSLAGWVTQRGYTIMRALPMDFPDDPGVHGIADQFMFGPSLLINPVTEYQARSRPVYLPGVHGWYDLHSGQYHASGETIEAEAPLERMPIFVKAGSIVPFGPDLQYTDEKAADPIRLYVYAGSDAVFRLYEDDGVSYGYESGAFTIIPLEYNDASDTLTIGDRRGRYPGMLETRSFEIVKVDPEAPVALDLEREAPITVRYDGTAQVVTLK